VSASPHNALIGAATRASRAGGLTATTRDWFLPASDSASVRQAEILKLSPELAADPDVDVPATSAASRRAPPERCHSPQRAYAGGRCAFCADQLAAQGHASAVMQPVYRGLGAVHAVGNLSRG
jgi:hypothetical protein